MKFDKKFSRFIKITAQAEADKRNAVIINQTIRMEKVEVGSDEHTDRPNSLNGSDVVDGLRAFSPIDNQNVEVVMVEQDARRSGDEVSGVVAIPAMRHNSQGLRPVERTVLNRSDVVHEHLNRIYSVGSGEQQKSGVPGSVEERSDNIRIVDGCAKSC